MNHKIATCLSLLLFAFSSQAAITYIDATGSNTTGATLTASAGGAGNDWKIRTGFANGDGVVAVGANSATAPELTTTIIGLNSGAEYEVYAYFWSITAISADRNWDIQVGLTSGSLTAYDASSVALSNVTNLSSTALNDTVVSAEFDSTTFSTPVLVAEDNRRLVSISLGTLNADINGNIAVFIDDDPGDNNRTWYDGVGYAIVPEPSSFALIMLGFGSLIALRRRT